MLQNAYLLAKIGFDAAENEPAKMFAKCRHILPILLILINFVNSFLLILLMLRISEVAERGPGGLVRRAGDAERRPVPGRSGPVGRRCTREHGTLPFSFRYI